MKEAIRHGLSLVGIRYKWWLGETIFGADVGPFYAANEEPPALEVLMAQGLCCTGLFNWIRRKLKLPVPGVISEHPLAGGTGCWYEFLAPYCEPFDETKDYPEGTVFFRPPSSFHDQGHIALVVGDGRLLHSYVDDPNPLPGFQEPGCTVDPTWKTSHNWVPGGYYKYTVKPEGWLRP